MRSLQFPLASLRRGISLGRRIPLRPLGQRIPLRPLGLILPLGALGLAVAAATPGRTMAPTAASTVAVQAGTIHLVQDGKVLEGGATILITDGKITAVGKDIDIPAGARVVDYGPDAVITPGLVAANSTFGGRSAAKHAVEPFVRAVDNFDAYTSPVFTLEEGITSVYMSPGQGRLISGQGAVVKLAGSSESARVLNDSAAIEGSIGDEARHTPGYWEPPVPATIDVGMGQQQQQLPHSLMGAVVALQELFEMARTGKDDPAYAPGVGRTLQELTRAHKPWRIGADTVPEIRALLDAFKQAGLPLILEGANEAAPLADEIAKSGVSVIVEAPIAPNQGGRDFGKDRDAKWPRYDAASALAHAGAKIAIAPGDRAPASDLRFAAALMSRGGLDAEAALRAITLSPAEMMGVADRIGSIVPGKDADLAVFNGSPTDSSASVLATWIDGEVVFSASDWSAKREKVLSTGTVVVRVGELYVGDGEVLTPGEMLMRDGKIIAVGRSVGRPAGAVVVKGGAAGPGMIDALGHLGLEGSTRVPPARFELKRLIEPGDFADKRVARAGVTTVAMSPRGVARNGTPMMAYKPAGQDIERMVVADPVALRFQWSDRNRRESGKALEEILKKATEYDKKWADYEEKAAKWTPPPVTADAGKSAGDAKEGDAKKDGEGADKKDDGEKKDAEKKDSEKKEEKKDSKDKKKKGEEEAPKAITGAWEAKITLPPFEEARMRLYVNDVDGKITGSLRCDTLSATLIQVSGKRDKTKVTLSGEGSQGTVKLEAESKDGKLEGHVMLGDSKAAFEAAQTSTEYEVVKRSEVRKPKDEKKPEVKGEPKAPGIDAELEPFRQAKKGRSAIVVGVDREDEILACVDAFEKAGIKPILLGAEDAWKVADKIRGRVAGVLLSQRVVWTEPKMGAEKRNRYAELESNGIPVAFHSDAEEGAADLPLIAAYAVSQGMSPSSAFYALTAGAAHMLAIDKRVGKLAPGLDADVVLYDRSPLDVSATVLRVWVNGKEVR